MKCKDFAIGHCAVILLAFVTAGCHHTRISGPIPADAHSNSLSFPGNADSIALLSISWAQEDGSRRGKPEEMTVHLEYTLATRDRAFLKLSLDQFLNRESCVSPQSNTSELVVLTPAEKEVPITRGTHMLEIPITWPGDTGDGTNGRIFGTGTLSLRASMRIDPPNYEFLTRRFGTEFCSRF